MKRIYVKSVVKPRESVSGMQNEENVKVTFSLHDDNVVKYVAIENNISGNNVRNMIEHALFQIRACKYTNRICNVVLIYYEADYVLRFCLDATLKAMSCEVYEISRSGYDCSYLSSQKPVCSYDFIVRDFERMPRPVWMADLCSAIAAKINEAAHSKRIKQQVPRETFDRKATSEDYGELSTKSLLEMYHEGYLKALRTIDQLDKQYEINRRFTVNWNKDIIIHVNMAYTFDDCYLIKDYDTVVTVDLERDGAIDANIYQNAITQTDSINKIKSVMDAIYNLALQTYIKV